MADKAVKTGITRTKDVETVIHQNDEGSGEHHARLSKSLSSWDLMGFGIGIVIGTGIFTLTGVEAKNHAGPAIVLSFAIAGVVSMLAAICYAELAAAVPTAGSSYTYAYTTIGEIFAWIIAWDLILEFALGAAVVSRGWSGYLQQLFGLPEAFFGEENSVVNLGAVAIALVLGIIAAVGIRESKLVTNSLVVIKVSVCIFVILFGAFFVKASNLIPWIPPSKPGEGVGGLKQPLWQAISGIEPASFGVTGVFVAAAVVFFAYSGFEAVANLGEETKNPAKDMPRGLIGTLVICTVLYLGVCLVLTGMVNYTDLSEGAPISDAFDQVGMGWASILINIAAIAGLSSVILVDIVAMGRIGFALCRDGLLPPSVGADPPEVPHPDPDHPRHHGRRVRARRLRPAGHARRDGQHRHPVRVRRRGHRGDRAAAYEAEDGTPLQDALGAGPADRLRGLLRRPDGEPGRRDLAAVPGLAGRRAGHLLLLRPDPLAAGARTRGRHRGGAGRRDRRLSLPRGDPDVCTR